MNNIDKLFKLNTKINSKRIYLRKLTKSDISKRYINWLNDTQVNIFISTRNTKQNYDSVYKYIKSFNKSRTGLLMGIFLNKTNQHIGNITLNPIDWNNNYSGIGICIGDKKYWRKGYAKEAMHMAINYGFKKLKFRRMEAGVNSMNIASLKLFSSLGFKHEGILRQREKTGNKYIDCIQMGLILTDKIYPV